jgi:uncharacterized protein
MTFPLSLFNTDGGYIRIPVWGHIPLTKPLKKILSHPAFLRLKGIKQLSFAHHVFPGATHTRFEHSIGVYHLTKLILQRITTSDLARPLQTAAFRFDEHACNLILASSLLHDIGHYPHAHIIESVGITNKNEIIFDDHQDLTHSFLFEKHVGFGSLADILENDWKLSPTEVSEMVTGKVKLTYSKLISGTLDPDKMDYLMRDAHHCSVPYGDIDIDRLIESFVPDAARRRFAITEKGIAPLESLLFAKYMMMRNVYWHHTVRTFSVMLKRAVHDALDEALITPEKIREVFYRNIDERVLHDFLAMCRSVSPEQPAVKLLHALIERRPFKRVITLPVSHDEKLFAVLAKNAPLRKEKEAAMCAFIARKTKQDLRGWEILIDAPSPKNIFDYRDFCDLQLYQEPKSNTSKFKTGKGRFTPFNACGESVFTAKFITEFEHATKRFRLMARADIAPAVEKFSREMLEILEN